METRNETVLVFGATGQQGGAVTRALLADGWKIRALVRDTGSAKAAGLADEGVETINGDLAASASIRAAMQGAYGVFSVQPSSGQGAAYNVTDEDEVRWGEAVADIAVETGVRHLVYSSANAAGPTPTGMGHFDTKSRIEEHVRSLGIVATVIRPAAFMEILALPGMGLDKGEFNSFVRSDQVMQFIAVEDIGRIVAHILADPGTFGSTTIEIAGDAVTGTELAAKFTRTIGRPIAYSRFPDVLLDENPFLGRLAALIDEGRLAGRADIGPLRERFPGMLTMDDWLAGSGRQALLNAANADGKVMALR